MLYFQCIGGLGNRLFIYAFARTLQLDSGDPHRNVSYASG